MSSRGAHWSLAVALALAGEVGCGAGAFTCEDASDCVDGAKDGTCQLDGFCSFPDGECPSGQRYGSHAGAASGECVPETGTSDTSGDPSTTQSTTADTLDSATLVTTADSTSDDASTTMPITTDPSTSTGIAATDGSSSDTSTMGPELALLVRFDEDDFANGIADGSPYAHDVTCPDGACPVAAPGYLGNAARFVGQGQCVIVPHGPAFTGLDAVTVSAFVQIDPMPLVADAHMIVGKTIGAVDRNSFELFLLDSNLLDQQMRSNFAVADDDSFLTVSAPDLSPSSMWYHLAGTWDGATAALWIDGEMVASGAQAMAVDDHAVTIGCDDDFDGVAYDNVFAGMIDEVRVYRELLTAEQIAILAAGGEP